MRPDAEPFDERLVMPTVRGIGASRTDRDAPKQRDPFGLRSGESLSLYIHA